METPILDFVRAYGASHTARLHMPGHKGKGPLGPESLDITEIAGADSLYEADGIIARSEANATRLFGTAATFYSTEGSSQCIRAMLNLALLCRGERSKVVVAARNVHRAFVYAAGLLDLEPVWLQSQESRSLCSCLIEPADLDQTLHHLPQPPACVYVTSPDYLGQEQDIAGLAEVCHRHGTIMAVDNAHGAYLRFLSPSRHPIDLGADLCCDSAHKTLPVMTGGAYLHLSHRLPVCFADHAKTALAMFGSTSPSYLILASLDGCNEVLEREYPKMLSDMVSAINRAKADLAVQGWCVLPSDPLKLTVRCSACGIRGMDVAELLRRAGIEVEFADRDDLVCMLTPMNAEEDWERFVAAMCSFPLGDAMMAETLPTLPIHAQCSIRAALFSQQEIVPIHAAQGRICGAPTVGCPPAIPICVSGELISEEAIRWMEYYGVETVSVVKSL